VPGVGGISIANNFNFRENIKTVVIGIVMIGLVTFLSVSLALAFNITDAFILSIIGLLPTILGVVVLLKVLDIL